jgi:hypothetical protein
MEPLLDPGRPAASRRVSAYGHLYRIATLFHPSNDEKNAIMKAFVVSLLASFGSLVTVNQLLGADPAPAPNPSPTSASPAPTGRPVSFELDIEPILAATGCNTGPCHGKQRGQNGFQLSLLGFDPDFDHDAIVRGGRGRRIFPAAPEQSLLLLKATAILPHGGGKRLELDSDDYRMLVDWIRQGATRRVESEPTLERVELATDKFKLTPGRRSARSTKTARWSPARSRAKRRSWRGT